MSAVNATRRILVVDDDEVMRQLLETLLPLHGYVVTSASTLDEGLRALSAEPRPELVLTDLQMPGADRATLAGSLRQAMPAESLLFAMSATAPDAPTLAAFDAFLLKPFDGEAVRQAERASSTARTANAGREGKQDAPTARQAAPVLDTAIFESLRDIITGPKLGELYEMTISDIRNRHERMQRAAAEGDLVTVKREAHATKGSCGMVGAQELQQIASRIEEGTGINPEEIRQIPEACDRLQRMLKNKLK